MSGRSVIHLSSVVAVSKPAALQGLDEPSAVLILGWVEAKFTQLQKCSQAYAELFPSSTHIMVRQGIKEVILSPSTRETTYAPVIDALEDAGVDCRNPGLSQGLIVHTFSNGGCSLLLLLSRLMQRRAPQPPLNDVARTLLVFDSGPGRGDFVKVHRGATATMNLATNALFTFFFFAPAFAIVQLYCLLMHQPDPIEGYRRDLARPDVFPWTRDTTPRLFLYGAQDNIVPRKDVEDHVADLRALGLATQLEMFATSGHIGHAKSEPLRYWGVVRDAWDEACDKAPRRRPVRITSRL